MKKFSSYLALMLCFTLALAAICLAADPAAVVAVPAAPVATESWFMTVLPWLSANQVIVGMLLIGILDFIFAINPEWKSNGVLHVLYVLLQKRTATVDRPVPPAPPTV